MFYMADLLKALHKTDIKEKNSLENVINANNHSCLKKYLKNNSLDVDKLIKNHNIKSISYRMGFDLMRHHFKKTGNLTQNEDFNRKYFSGIESAYVKKETKGKYKKLSIKVKIDYLTGKVTVKE